MTSKIWLQVPLAGFQERMLCNKTIYSEPWKASGRWQGSGSTPTL